MKTPLLVAAAGAASLLASLPAADAALVDVTITGVVEYNQVGFGALGAVGTDDPATITFQVDSDVFVNGSFPTRGYAIDPSSFTFTIGPASLGLQSPFPAGQTPYFGLRNDDPAVDGFWITTDPDFPLGLPTDEPGQLGQFVCNQYVTYTGDTLASLDIVDAVGTYDFTGLTVFHFTVDDGPAEPVGLVFESLTIELAEAPCADTNGDGEVNVDDLVDVIQNWGICPGCATDLNGDNRTDVNDLVLVITGWGPCP